MKRLTYIGPFLKKIYLHEDFLQLCTFVNKTHKNVKLEWHFSFVILSKLSFNWKNSNNVSTIVHFPISACINISVDNVWQPIPSDADSVLPGHPGGLPEGHRLQPPHPPHPGLWGSAVEGLAQEWTPQCAGPFQVNSALVFFFSAMFNNIIMVNFCF